jgi:hypothetical protein
MPFGGSPVRRSPRRLSAFGTEFSNDPSMIEGSNAGSLAVRPGFSFFFLRQRGRALRNRHRLCFSFPYEHASVCILTCSGKSVVRDVLSRVTYESLCSKQAACQREMG